METMSIWCDERSGVFLGEGGWEESEGKVYQIHMG